MTWLPVPRDVRGGDGSTASALRSRRALAAVAAPWRIASELVARGRACLASRAAAESLVKHLASCAAMAQGAGVACVRQQAAMSDPLMARGLELAARGEAPDAIEAALRSELDATEDRHAAIQGLFGSLGACASAGALAGAAVCAAALWWWSGHWSAPGYLGSLGTAALAGVAVGGALRPLLLAALQRLAARDLMRRTLVVRGTMAICRGEHPQAVRRELLALLPPPPQTQRGRRAA